MSESLFSGMRTASTALASERMRLDVIAENIANARTTNTPEGGPYKRRVVNFEPILQKYADGSTRSQGVRVASVERDLESPTEWVHDPSHPDANEAGLVEMPNVNTLMEMADLITAMRAYEANMSVQENFVRMAERALQLAR